MNSFKKGHDDRNYNEMCQSIEKDVLFYFF